MNKSRNTRPLQGSVSVGHPVNVATGVLYHEFKDCELSGRIPLVLPRRYSTDLLEKESGIFGPGWHCPLEMKISRDLDGYSVTDPSGEVDIYFNITNQRLNSGEVARNLGAFHELKIQGNEIKVTHWNVDTGDITHDFYPMSQGGEWTSISRREDVEGNALLFSYNENGQLEKISQMREQRSLALEYDEHGHLGKVFQRTAALEEDQQETQAFLQYGYDEKGRLIKFTDPLGVSSHYKYDDVGQMINERTLGGMIYTFRFDDQGRCNYLSGKNNFDLNRLQFDDLTRTTEVTNSLGHTTTYHWNEYNQVEKVISPAGKMCTTIYDNDARIVAKITPGGSTTDYKYDERGNRSCITLPDGGAVLYSHNRNHQIVSITDPLGNEWKREYDDQGRQATLINPLEASQIFTYNDHGDLIKHGDCAGNVRRFKWDGYGQLSSATDWRGNRHHYSWDAFGNLVEYTDALGNDTGMTRDRIGHLLEIVFPDGNKRSYEWDVYKNLKLFTDENNVSLSWNYCACGSIEEQIKPDGHKISYGWNTVPGQMAHIRNENGDLYYFEYDEDGRLIQETDFSGTETRYDFDMDGRISAISRPSGAVSRFQHDEAGRITSIKYSDGGTIDYKYDTRGLLIEADNKDCPVSFEYDALGRVIRETQGEHAIEHEYDELNNRVLRKSSLGGVSEFSWNPNGQISSIRTGTFEPVQFEYDARNDESKRLLGTDLVLDQEVNQRGHLIEQTLRQESGSRRQLIKQNYQYDAASNLLTKHDSLRGTTKYTYDILERIEATLHPDLKVEHFNYDANSNIDSYQQRQHRSDNNLDETGYSSEKWKYLPGNQLIDRDGIQYEYDEDQHLISKTEDRLVTRYIWNHKGQLKSIQKPDGSEWFYRYDGLNRRVEKRGPGTHIEYVWDADVILYEICHSGSTQATGHIHLWEFHPHDFSLVFKQENRQQQYFSVNDQIGTPLELVGKEGETVWSGRLLTFGQCEFDGKNKIECDIRFQGQWHDLESGLCYNWHRYFDPETSKFLTNDPIGFTHGLNLSNYPRKVTSWVDPLGLTIMCDDSDDVVWYHGSMDVEDLRKTKFHTKNKYGGEGKPPYVCVTTQERIAKDAISTKRYDVEQMTPKERAKLGMVEGRMSKAEWKRLHDEGHLTTTGDPGTKEYAGFDHSLKGGSETKAITPEGVDALNRSMGK